MVRNANVNENQNWMQEQLFLLAKRVKEKDIIKGTFGVGITSEP